MEFRTPYLSILVIVLAILWTLDYFKVLKKPQIIWSQADSNVKKSLFFYILYATGITGFIFLMYAVSGPRISNFVGDTEIEVNDIFMVVDVSKSMLAEDFEPNRMEVARKQVRDFLKLRPANRIGIVMFSEKAYTLLPLTQDLTLVEQAVSDIQIGPLGSGTNIGDALALAVAREVASEAKRKVIILLTDGVSNVGNMTPLDAAKQAKDNNIVIYSIGIGSDEKARMPVGPANGIFGQRYQYLPGGSYDMKTLKEISELTGGKAYAAKNENGLKSIFDQIEELEKTKVKVTGSTVYKELYFPYYFWALIFLFITEISRWFWRREMA